MNQPTPSPKPSLHLVSNNRTSNEAPNTESALFGAHAAQNEPRNWKPLIAGFVLVVAVVALIALLGHSHKTLPQAADPYSPMLVVQQTRISQADNFVGSTVTYIDLTAHNSGNRTVIGGLVTAVFRDSLGQPVQTETLPLHVLMNVAGQQQAGDLALAPLASGQTRVLRLTLEHISSQWNQQQPDLEFRGLRFK